VQRLKDRFVGFAIDPVDSPEWKLRKSILTAIDLLLVVVYLVYGGFYAAVGVRVAAQAAFVAAIAQALICLLYVRVRSYYLSLRLTNALGLLALLAIHLALGGFTSSGYVLIYATVSLFLATAFEDPRYVKHWFAATIGVMVLACVGEIFVPHGNPMSPVVLAVFTLFNIVGFLNFVLVPSVIHGERTRAINLELAAAREAQLAQKAEHLAQTQQALEQQTATAGILRVIAASPSDVQPVFDAIVHSAARLFGRNTALRTVEDDGLRRRARSYDSTADEFHGPDVVPIDRHSVSGRAVLERRAVQVADNRAPGSDISFKSQTRELSFRSMASAPLMRDSVAVGVISMSSPQPGALTDQQMDLLQTFADQAVIAIQNVRLFRETNEALERQTATAEILKVIASSPSDVQPVFEAIANSSNRLIGGFSTAVFRIFNDKLHLVAFTPANPAADDALKASFPRPLVDVPAAAPLREGAVVRITDTEDQAQAPTVVRDLARLRGYRSMMFCPLLRGRQLIGMISVTRREPGPFAPHQVALLQTFADQAVIAIENARLFNETQEALARQTATANVLKAISRSTFDLAAVLDTLISTAARLCQAWLGVIFRVEDDLCHAAGLYGATPALIEHLQAHPISLLDQNSVTSKAVALKAPYQVEDASDSRVYGRVDVQQVGGYRTLLAVPILREGVAVGVLTLGRQEARLFNDKEIELVTSFADQAAIAMENVRLFNETKEALERQTATAEVLEAIGSSVADTQPVFDKIVDSCRKLFATTDVAILLVDDQAQVHLAAAHGPASDPLRRTFPRPLAGGGVEHAIRQRRVLLHRDVLADADVHPGLRAVAGLIGIGTYSQAMAPMLWEGRGIGVITVTRQPATGFSEQEIGLLKTFADQAVIAIQNARLFNETQEALERQTATSEILQVISGSPTDVQPVLHAVAERAAKICDAQFVDIILREGETIRGVAVFGDLGGPTGEPMPLDRSTVMGRAIVDRHPVHVHDLQQAQDDYPRGSDLARRHGHHTTLAVPLMREGRALGAILVRRTEVQPFDDKHVALLRTFADQAAIAMENVRLFNETQAALQRQTATAEVLQVISSSVADTAPVFEKIIQSCETLFTANTPTSCWSATTA
jgi:GAF domain-containing protein